MGINTLSRREAPLGIVIFSMPYLCLLACLLALVTVLSLPHGVTHPCSTHLLLQVFSAGERTKEESWDGDWTRGV